MKNEQTAPNFIRHLQDEDADHFLIERINISNDQYAFEELVQRYMPLIRKIANKFFVFGADYEDLVQEGLVGLFKAVRVYDVSRENDFVNLAYLCIRRSVLQIVRSQNSQKALAHHLSVSLHSPICTNGGNYLLIDRIRDCDSSQTENMISDFDADILRSSILESLSDLEENVFRLLCDNQLPYSAIAELAGIHTKSVDNAIQRIRRKAAKIVAELDIKI